MNSQLWNVNFSERLVLLIRETRQLLELGFKNKINPDILNLVEAGK